MSKYSVNHGYGLSQDFEDFSMALRFYAETLNMPGLSSIVGEGYEPGDDDGMGKSDGLTEAEREAVEAVSDDLTSVPSEDFEFQARLDRISNKIAYEQPLEGVDPLEVMAAQLRMGWDESSD